MNQPKIKKKRNKHCRSAAKRIGKVPKKENKPGYKKRHVWIYEEQPTVTSECDVDDRIPVNDLSTYVEQEHGAGMCATSMTLSEEPAVTSVFDKASANQLYDVSEPEHRSSLDYWSSSSHHKSVQEWPASSTPAFGSTPTFSAWPLNNTPIESSTSFSPMNQYNWAENSHGSMGQSWSVSNTCPANSTPIAAPTSMSSPAQVQTDDTSAIGVASFSPMNQYNWAENSTPTFTAMLVQGGHVQSDVSPEWAEGTPDQSSIGVAMESLLLLEKSTCCDFPEMEYPMQSPRGGMRNIFTAEGQVCVFDIPSNGNCLFLALCHQLYGYQIGSHDLNKAALQLRSEVAEYLRSNLPFFYHALCAEVQYWGNRFHNVDIHVPRCVYDQFNTSIQYDNFHASLQKILQYLEDLKKDGEIWGSHECMVAVAEMFKVSIEVHIENANKVSIIPSSGHGAKLEISHRRYSPTTTIYPDHYDSVEHSGIGKIRSQQNTIHPDLSVNTYHLVPAEEEARAGHLNRKEAEAEAAESLLSLFKSVAPAAQEIQETPAVKKKTLGVRLTSGNPKPTIPCFTPVRSQDQLNIPCEWIHKTNAEGIVYAKVSESLVPLIRVSIGNSGAVKCDVCGIGLEQDHGLYTHIKNKTPSEICAIIDQRYKICPGASGEKYAYLWDRTKGGIHDKQNKTFRSKSCSLLVRDDARCLPCRSLGGALRTAHSRHQDKENMPSKVCPQKRPHCSMTNDEKDRALKTMGKQIKYLKTAKDNINKRLEESKENGIDLKDLGGTFHKIMDKYKGKMTKMQQLFWEQQCKALSCKSDSSMKWHPMMIRLAIRYESKGPGCYDEMRNILRLPCKTALKDYTHINPEHLGIRKQNIEKLLENMPSHDKGNYVSLLFDEMTIREGVVFDSKSGRLIGYTNLDDVEEEIERLDSNCSSYKPQLAKKVLVYMAKNLTGGKTLKEVVGIYAVKSATADQIFKRTWTVIEELENWSLKVLCLVCDGAKTNRSFFKMMGPSPSDSSQEARIPFSTRNIFSGDDERELFFISDVPHLIKCLRNNFATNKLWKNGQDISWDTIRKLYEISKTETLRRTCKLTNAHVELDNFSKMKVFYAAQVLSETVASELELMDPVSCRETITFIRLADRFFDCLNGRHSLQGKQALKKDLNAYQDKDDSRFQFLQEVVEYFDDWKKEVLKRPGRFSNKDRKEMTISDDTREGIYITVNGFTGVVRHLLSSGINYVNARDTCQDDLEQYFGHQRSVGRLHNNPPVKQILHSDTKISLGNQLARELKNANSRLGQAEAEDLDNTPLTRRKRTRR